MTRFCLGIALLLCFGAFAAPAAAGITEFLDLTPSEATNPVGTNHTLTATVTGVEEDPRSNRQVAFVVTAGPNIGDTGDDCTDEAGQAHFTYTGDGGPGTDTITATVTGSCGDLAAVSSLGGQGVSDTATKTWVAESPAPPPAPPPAAPPSPPPAGGAAPSGALPFTGFPVWIVLLAAAGLIGAGAWLLPRARKTH
jgi:hypothetical protein